MSSGVRGHPRNHPGKPAELHGMPRTSMEVHGDKHGMPWNAVECRGFPWSNFPWNSVEIHGNSPWKSTAFHVNSVENAVKKTPENGSILKAALKNGTS